MLSIIKRFLYKGSNQQKKDQAKFKNRTGFDFNDPIFKKFKYVPPQDNNSDGHYTHQGKKYKAVCGKMVQLT